MSAVGSKNTRRSFTAAFKRAAILHAEETNNCAAGWKFGIGECVVQKWRLQREEMFSCDSKRRGFRGPKSGRFSKLEAKLAAYVTDLRDRSLLVTCEMVTQQARVYAVQAGIPRSQFKATAVPRDAVVRSFAKCGLTLDDDVLWDCSSNDGSSTSEDDSSDDE
ncbi:hypothetical protein HPB51_005203 [Rhipicephalus microplus]|uniref:Brinker DNA-binding domain-containing protein n=1 Tax=Rhipicephalus microplus TaxID=6941 RepID=A0A9J6E750_RHIMP|nr:hypothetical protein HPB51_005203 [Rhipicephalus microplus]